MSTRSNYYNKDSRYINSAPKRAYQQRHNNYGNSPTLGSPAPYYGGSGGGGSGSSSPSSASYVARSSGQGGPCLSPSDESRCYLWRKWKEFDREWHHQQRNRPDFNYSGGASPNPPQGGSSSVYSFPSPPPPPSPLAAEAVAESGVFPVSEEQLVLSSAGGQFAAATAAATNDSTSAVNNTIDATAVPAIVYVGTYSATPPLQLHDSDPTKDPPLGGPQSRQAPSSSPPSNPCTATVPPPPSSAPAAPPLSLPSSVVGVGVSLPPPAAAAALSSMATNAAGGSNNNAAVNSQFSPLVPGLTNNEKGPRKGSESLSNLGRQSESSSTGDFFFTPEAPLSPTDSCPALPTASAVPSLPDSDLAAALGKLAD